MKFLKENWKMLAITTTVVILFPIIILTPSRYGTIPYDTGIAIVGYGGSILGGFLTLYGVWWTILEQKKDLKEQQKKLDNQRRKDLAMQYRPILNCQVKEHTVIENNSVLVVSFILKNTGRAEALNIHIESISTLPVATMITSDTFPMLEMNNNLIFVVTFVHQGKNIGGNVFEHLPLDDLYAIKKINPNALIKITFSDIVNTNYCFQFNVECLYLPKFDISTINGMDLSQIGEKIKKSPKKWKFALTNLKITEIN